MRIIDWGLSAEADFGTTRCAFCMRPADHPFDRIVLLRNGLKRPESFTEGSKNVRHLLRYLSIQRDPEFFPTYHH